MSGRTASGWQGRVRRPSAAVSVEEIVFWRQKYFSSKPFKTPHEVLYDVPTSPSVLAQPARGLSLERRRTKYLERNLCGTCGALGSCGLP